MYDNLARDGWRDPLGQELINGKPVLMVPAPPRHTHIAGNIYYIFKKHLKGQPCVPFPDGTIVQLSEKDRFVPDFMLVCDRSKIGAQQIEGAPDLVAEVLSPGTASRDKWEKKNAYEAAGVPEYWIVSPLEKTIEVYLLQEGRYVLDHLYTHFSPQEQEELKVHPPEDRPEVVASFRCHLYDDLDICLDDIFGDLF